MGKSLTVYFSATGVTKSVAEKIAEATHSDLFRIEPTIPYSNADLDWTDKNSRTTKEMQDHSFRPEISKKCENMKEYDTIFLGFPIWWYVAPTIINTFLESYDFTGKTIRPFFTSGGSGAGQTDEKLHLSAPNAIWRPAKRLYVGNDQRTVDWANDKEV